MSAASTKVCIVCQASSSKYKCPKCAGPTCSLLCSKKHKGDVHPTKVNNVAPSSSTGDQISDHQSNQPVPSSSNEEMLPPLRQFSNSKETIVAPSVHKFEKVNRFIPMNAYDEANMLEDFEYLQFMGRRIATLGRDLVKKGWYKHSDQDGDAKNASGSAGQRDGRNKRNRFKNSSEKLSSESRNRQQYEQSIRRLKIPIMLLPDGMSARKENQSRFKVQMQELMCTVQISFPCGVSEDKRSKRSIQHHTPWNKKIADIVRSEIAKRMRNMRFTGKDAPDQVNENDGEWQTSLWEALFGISPQIPANIEGDQILTEIMSQQIVMVIPVHSEKLRNETSARFLEWWQRQVRNGMVLEGGLKFDEEKKLALEKKRNGEWAPIEGLPIVDGAIREDALDSEQSSTGLSKNIDITKQTGLISSFLLDRLQSQRESQKKKEIDLPDSTAKKQTPLYRDVKAIEKETIPTTIRQLVVLRGNETIEEVLRRLQKGYAVVEYPHIEVWNSVNLSEEMARGSVKRIELSSIDGGEQDRHDELHTTINKQGALMAKRPAESIPNDTLPKKPKMEPISPQNTTSNYRNPTTSALNILSAYASSEEEDGSDKDGDNLQDDEGDIGEEEAHSRLESQLLEHFSAGAATNGSLVDIARSLGMIRSSDQQHNSDI